MNQKKLLYPFSALALLALIAFLVPANDSQIYSQIFHRLVSVDDTYAGKLNPKKVYVSLELRDNFLDAASDKKRSNLDDEQKASISRAAEEAGMSISWIASREELKFEKDGEITGGGVLIEFSNIDSLLAYAQASGCVHISGLAAGGGRYDFLRIFGHWKLLYRSAKWIS